MKASELRPGQFFDYTTAIDVRRCLCLFQDEVDTWIFDATDTRTYRIDCSTTIANGVPQCWGHEWEVVDDSFDHEFGTEKMVYERCELCGATRDLPQTFEDDVL
jgi:hypothetical protein